MTHAQIFACFLAGAISSNCLIKIAQIGKPAVMWTPANAAFVTLETALWVFGIFHFFV